MATITGIRIDTDDTITTVELDDTNLLRSLYNSLGCRVIETLSLREGIEAIFDEEGKIIGDTGNDTASIAALLLGHTFLPGDYLAGPVIFLGRTGGKYNTLAQQQRSAVLAAITS